MRTENPLLVVNNKLKLTKPPVRQADNIHVTEGVFEFNKTQIHNQNP